MKALALAPPETNFPESTSATSTKAAEKRQDQASPDCHSANRLPYCGHDSGFSTRSSTHRLAQSGQSSPRLTPTTQGRSRASFRRLRGGSSAFHGPNLIASEIFSSSTSNPGRARQSFSSRPGGAWNSHYTAGRPNPCPAAAGISISTPTNPVPRRPR